MLTECMYHLLVVDVDLLVSFLVLVVRYGSPTFTIIYLFFLILEVNVDRYFLFEAFGECSHKTIVFHQRYNMMNNMFNKATAPAATPDETQLFFKALTTFHYSQCFGNMSAKK